MKTGRVLAFVTLMRRLLHSLLFLVLSTALHAAPMPAELEKALKNYRAEGAPHWGYVQATESAKGLSLLEQFDPSKPPFQRWTLLKKNGAVPSEADLKDYRERLSRRTTGTAPNLKDQIDPASCELLNDDGIRASYRFKLLTTDKTDHSAAHMQAVFTLHKPSDTIECVKLSAFEPFSPMFAVKVTEAETTITYSLPDGQRPTLLQKITVHMRGSVMWFKSLDDDMTVTYSGHFTASKKSVSEQK